MHYSMETLAGLAVCGFTLVGCDSTRPLVATRVAFQNQPLATLVSGQPLGAVRVAVTTDDGRPVSGTGFEVTIRLSSSDTSAHLTGTTTVHTNTGVASFDNLAVARAGTGFQLVAQVTGFESARSQPFAVTPGPATQLRFEPSGILAVFVANEIPAVVRVTDAAGNTVSDATNTVTLGYTRGPYGLTAAPEGIFGPTTAVAAHGVATFSGVSFHKTGSYTFSATAAGLSGAMSGSFTVNSGPLTRLIFLTEPTSGTTSAALPPFSVLQVDDFGNGLSLPTLNTYSATLSFGNNPSGAALGGTLNPQGIAVAALTFGDISVNKPGTGYTLTATSNGRTATSTPFDIQ